MNVRVAEYANHGHVTTYNVIVNDEDAGYVYADHQAAILDYYYGEHEYQKESFVYIETDDLSGYIARKVAEFIETLGA